MDSNRLVLDANADIFDRDTLKEAFGIRIYDGSIAPFAKVGDSYPISGSYTFSTNEDHQDQITLEFHRSPNRLASRDSFLGIVRIRGFKLAKAQIPLIRIHFDISDSQIHVWATNELKNSDIELTLIKNSDGVFIN